MVKLRMVMMMMMVVSIVNLERVSCCLQHPFGMPTKSFEIGRYVNTACARDFDLLTCHVGFGLNPFFANNPDNCCSTF